MEVIVYDMPCFHPLIRCVNRDGEVNPDTGKLKGKIIGSAEHFAVDSEIFKEFVRSGYYQLVPCGQCLGCRIQRAKDWTVRIIHEASFYENNCFITLTFDDEHLPANGSVDVRDLQLFMKRLRKKFQGIQPVDIKNPITGEIETKYPIRFFACGEYGSELQRPHYHLIIFNWKPDDLVLRGVNKYGNRIYSSPSLYKLWNKGFNTVGSVTEASAGYVAKYCVKKVNGERANAYYNGRSPEFIVMSRNPGIASNWFEKYHDDVFNYDELRIAGKPYHIPRYYDKLYDDIEPCKFAQIKANRLKKLQKFTGCTINVKQLKNKEKKLKIYVSKKERNLTND